MTEIEPKKNEQKQEMSYQISPCNPVHILSPEFRGTSNYVGMTRLTKKRPETNPLDIHQAEEDLKTLDYLYENFNIGMNVFRTTKGGRNKIRE
ncbi:MAG: hypothetical protein HW420_323 [Candidatus Nitrosotenuis sp.]|nr:hypothetical protein [Candidatus Nitrosotenuis sp.]